MSDDVAMVTNRLCVRTLSVYCGGATSRGVDRGRSVVILGFVECQFSLLHSQLTFAGG